MFRKSTILNLTLFSWLTFLMVSSTNAAYVGYICERVSSTDPEITATCIEDKWGHYQINQKVESIGIIDDNLDDETDDSVFMNNYLNTFMPEESNLEEGLIVIPQKEGTYSYLINDKYTVQLVVASESRGGEAMAKTYLFEKYFIIIALIILILFFIFFFVFQKKKKSNK